VAEGLHVDHAQAAIRSVNIGEIFGGTLAIGTHLDTAANTTYTAGASNATSATTCFGILSSGDATGIIIDGVSAGGCSVGNGGQPTPAQATVGVDFDQCPALSIGAAPIFRNAPLVTGGTVGNAADGGAGLAIGIIA